VRGAARSLLCLPPSLAAAFAAAGALGRVAPELQQRAGPPLFLAVVLLCAGAGGAAWGRALGGRALGAALGYGLTAPLALWGLTAAESALLMRAQECATFPMHVVFGVLFASATLVVVLGAVLGLARDARLAVRCAAAGALAFVLVDVAMDLAGWRVGGPNAEARLTMLVVLGVGLMAATVVAGGLAGRALGAAAQPRSSATSSRAPASGTPAAQSAAARPQSAPSTLPVPLYAPHAQTPGRASSSTGSPLSE